MWYFRFRTRSKNQGDWFMIEVEILDSGIKAGILAFDDEKYIFTYDEQFLKAKDTTAISLTLPKQKEPFISKTLQTAFFPILLESKRT